MERNRPVPVSDKAVTVPYLALAKCVGFVILATFILYLPLGDPHSPQSTNKRTGFGAVCCICDIYELMFKIYLKILEVFQYLANAVKDALYDAKIQFYGILQRMDRKDLCRSACAEEWEEDVNELDPERRHRRPICRCVKKKCCRQI